MCEPRLRATNDEGGSRGAHAAEIGIGLRLGEDPRVRQGERLGQGDRRIASPAAEVFSFDGVGGETRGRGASAMSAHPVSDDEQPAAGLAAGLLLRGGQGAEVLQRAQEAAVRSLGKETALAGPVG